jgi:hypothetical protein
MATRGKDLLALMPQQHRTNEPLVALINGISELIARKLEQPLDDLMDKAQIDAADDYWLDQIGTRLSLRRSSLSGVQFFGFAGNDSAVGFDLGPLSPQAQGTAPLKMADGAFRTVIKAKGAYAITDGSQPEMTKSLSQAAKADGKTGELPAEAIYYDNQDMTMALTIVSDQSEPVLKNLFAQQVVPKPGGVRLATVTQVPLSGAFGFAGNDLARGFDQTPYSKTFTYEELTEV